MHWKAQFEIVTISSLRRELSPARTLKWPGRSRVQITCSTPSAYHVEHAVCHLVRRHSSAIKFDKVEIAFILALFYWLKPLTDEQTNKQTKKKNNKKNKQTNKQTKKKNTNKQTDTKIQMKQHSFEHIIESCHHNYPNPFDTMDASVSTIFCPNTRTFVHSIKNLQRNLFNRQFSPYTIFTIKCARA